MKHTLSYHQEILKAITYQHSPQRHNSCSCHHIILQLLLDYRMTPRFILQSKYKEFILICAHTHIYEGVFAHRMNVCIYSVKVAQSAPKNNISCIFWYHMHYYPSCINHDKFWMFTGIHHKTKILILNFPPLSLKHPLTIV